ncbi:MAG: ABC transporter permease [Aestuariivirga sp.]|uniref:ABC transporter permease n=2 Tax=Aestuariivirga sp. TaxID=2650926 RepID=UPI0030173F7E
MALMVAYSFWSVDDNYQLIQNGNLDQYAKVFENPIYLMTLLSSVIMALLTTIFCVILALPLAWFISRSVSARWRVLFIVGLILPGWVSLLIRTYSMSLVLGEEGLLNWSLAVAGVTESPIQILFTKPAVVIGLVNIYLPYTFVPIYAAIEKLDDSILEAAENLGAGVFRRLFKVILPLIMPGIVAGCIITFIPALGEYLVPNLLGGLQGTMYGNLIATAFQGYNWPLGSALSVVLLLAIFGSLFLLSRFADVSRSLLAEQ